MGEKKKEIDISFSGKLTQSQEEGDAEKSSGGKKKD